MPYGKFTAYFMSGTGNSYRVAEWLGEQARKNGAQASVIPVDRACPEEEIEDAGDQLVALVTATHGFTAPWRTLKFAASLPRVKHAHAICVATRAGLKIGRLFTPGLSGTTTFILALILALKGYKLRGVNSIDMPSNWTAVHPGLKEKSARAIIDRGRVKTEAFSRTILSGGRNWVSRTNIYEFIGGIALLWISLAYLLMGRFFLAKLFFANIDCNGCGLCAKQCPNNALRMIGEGKKARPFWRYDCESCMRCMSFCPERAIEAGHSWAVVVWIITSVPVSVYFFSWLTARWPGAAAWDNGWTRELIYLAYAYPALFLSYYIFYGLIRIRAVNALFTYTTFTRIFRRYHEPDTKVKALTGRALPAAGKDEEMRV